MFGRGRVVLDRELVTAVGGGVVCGEREALCFRMGKYTEAWCAVWRLNYSVTFFFVCGGQ